MRALGVDFGGARIGLAVMELAHGIGSPLKPLAASGTLARDAEAIAQEAKKQEAKVVVVGLPLNEDGTDTKMSKICRRLADAIRTRGVEVAEVDEAMTSQMAETDLREEGLKASEIRRQVDGEAAIRILMRWREAHESRR